MSGKSMSMQYEIKQICLDGVTNKNTVKSYKHSTDDFVSWAKAQGYKTCDDIRAVGAADIIQKYYNSLMSGDGRKSPATAHTKIAPICKGLGVKMADLDLERRTADAIWRGRDPAANDRGRHEETLDKYARLMTLASTGLRRDEIRKLKKSDLVTDESGYTCVHVARGKGGKEQLQRVLPQYLPTVQAVFDAVKSPEGRVLTDTEMRNHINIHSHRARVAREAYSYYAGKLKTEPEYRQKLRSELIDRYTTYHKASTGNRFVSELDNHKPVMLRGANKAKAEAAGLPITYDRLALMAVSVYHLSHWRIDVTVTNYMVY